MQESCTALYSIVQMYLLMLAAIELMLVAHVICIHAYITIQAHFDTKISYLCKQRSSMFNFGFF